METPGITALLAPLLQNHRNGCDCTLVAAPPPHHCLGGISLPTYLCDLLGDVLGALHHLVGSNYLDLRGGARAVLLQVELHKVECELGDLADGPVLHEVRVRGGVRGIGFDVGSL